MIESTITIKMQNTSIILKSFLRLLYNKCLLPIWPQKEITLTSFLFFLESQYKQKYIICSFVCLTQLIWRNTFEIPPYCWIIPVFILGDIPSYGHTTVFYSPVDEQLGCSQFGAIMNKAVMHIHEKAFVWTYILIYFI